MRGRGCEGRGWQQGEMVEDDWNCLMHAGWGGGEGVCGGDSYFAWLWLARAADFTMDGLISVEGLVLSDHGKAFCHRNERICVSWLFLWHPFTRKPALTMYSFAQNRPGPNPIHTLNPAEAHESQLTDLECIFQLTNNDAHTLSTINQKSNILAHLC